MSLNRRSVIVVPNGTSFADTNVWLVACIIATAAAMTNMGLPMRDALPRKRERPQHGRRGKV